MNRERNFKMVLTAAFIAIIIIMAFVPFLGYIPLGFINATIIHIPVIIGSILLGPKNGAFLGFVFGCTSLWKNTFMPNLTSFVFSPFVKVGDYGGNIWSLIICFVPRILIGFFAYYVYKRMISINKDRKSIAYFISGVVGSLTNTLLVMNLIYFCFANQYASARNWEATGVYASIMSIIVTSGIPEAIIAGILTAAIVPVLIKVSKN